MNTVSSASITGMVVSLLLCVAAPVALCVLLKRRTGAKLSDMLLGAVVFVIFAMFLEQMLHLAMRAVFGEKLTGNLWLSALYGGAAAAIFEEFGRLIAMKYFLGSQLKKENALMYGVGHGGVEALFVGGLTCVSNLATSAMVNGGKLESALAGLDEATRDRIAPRVFARLQSAAVVLVTHDPREARDYAQVTASMDGVQN